MHVRTCTCTHVYTCNKTTHSNLSWALGIHLGWVYMTYHSYWGSLGDEIGVHISLYLVTKCPTCALFILYSPAGLFSFSILQFLAYSHSPFSSFWPILILYSAVSGLFSFSILQFLSFTLYSHSQIHACTCTCIYMYMQKHYGSSCIVLYMYKPRIVVPGKSCVFPADES